MNFLALKKLAQNAKQRVVDSTRKGYDYGGEKGRQGHDAGVKAMAKVSKKEDGDGSAGGRPGDHDSRSDGAQPERTAATAATAASEPSDMDSAPPTQASPPSSQESSLSKTVAETSGGIFGAIGGALLGVARAGYGIPKDIARQRAKEAQQKGFREQWGPRELGRIYAPRAMRRAAVRVVCVRHGHGYHNDAFGVSSMGNRDAALSELGREQAITLGGALAKMASWDLVVVSPFRRTLETCALVLGEDAPRRRTIVQPLCGEHCGGAFEGNLDELNRWRAMVARGDLGSQPARLRELFDADRYPQYAESLAGLQENWWCHGRKDGFETRDSFLERARNLRLWLAEQASDLRVRQRERHPEVGHDVLPVILLVSHGGILSSCFEFENDRATVAQAQRTRGKMQNCEVRVYDVCTDGSFGRPVGDEEAAGAAAAAK